MSIMSTESTLLEYPYSSPPPNGTTQEVAPGVRWLQMPLPMSLKYINLYLIEDDDGWTIIDTGLRGNETQDLWLKIIENELKGKPVTRIICTHMHPDHTGQAGFLTEHCRVSLSMSFKEYFMAKTMGPMTREGNHWETEAYFERAGIEKSFLQELQNMPSSFAPTADDAPFPISFTRLEEGEVLSIGGNNWDIICGNGHSPEHVCLYSEKLRILISGDQILPIVTSNVSVHPTEPEANPLQGWLESHVKFKALIPNDTLVLPAHNLPFYNVQARLDELIEHHEDRMLQLEENCVEPQVATDLLPILFARKLEGYTKIMALGECIAHLHCLMSRNRIERTLEGHLYKYRSIDSSLASRSHPDNHEPPAEVPTMV
ncbi:MAG: glyoxylase-like metal-dependent hydrolase (beta-lactamase superfamily II) [Candidatus Azotimanducaceae bacterium]